MAYPRGRRHSCVYKTPRQRVNAPGHGHQDRALTPDSAYTPGGRRYARHLRLLKLGYDSYADYIGSPAWAAKRAEYRASKLPQACGLCGESEGIHLHHLTYERIGEERLEDLRPLCRRCHRTVHALDERGDMGLDFAGMVDFGRAKQNREARRQRETAMLRTRENSQDLQREREALLRYERQLRNLVKKRNLRKARFIAQRYRRCEKRIRWLEENPRSGLRQREPTKRREDHRSFPILE